MSYDSLYPYSGLNAVALESGNIIGSFFTRSVITCMHQRPSHPVWTLAAGGYASVVMTRQAGGLGNVPLTVTHLLGNDARTG
jgi:hypothetical protein